MSDRQWGQPEPVSRDLPLAHPKVTIEVRVIISGDWVTPEVIADTAHALAGTLARQLNAVDPSEVPITLDVKMDPDPGPAWEWPGE